MRSGTVDLLWPCITPDGERLAIGGRQSHGHHLVSGKLATQGTTIEKRFESFEHDPFVLLLDRVLHFLLLFPVPVSAEPA